MRSFPALTGMQLLSQNLIQTNEVSKSQKIETLDVKTRAIEERVNSTINDYNKRISGLKEEVLRLQKGLEDESRAYDHAIEAHSNEIGIFQEKVIGKMESEAAARKDSEAKLLRVIEEKANSLRQELSKDSKIRSEIIEGLTQTLENDIPKLYDSIKSAATDRGEADAEVLKKFGEDYAKVNENFVGEKKRREESENSIYEMMRDLVNRVKSEIEGVRKERENSEETLLNLIEDACDKINTLQQGQ